MLFIKKEKKQHIAKHSGFIFAVIIVALFLAVFSVKAQNNDNQDDFEQVLSQFYEDQIPPPLPPNIAETENIGDSSQLALLLPFPPPMSPTPSFILKVFSPILKSAGKIKDGYLSVGEEILSLIDLQSDNLSTVLSALPAALPAEEEGEAGVAAIQDQHPFLLSFDVPPIQNILTQDGVPTGTPTESVGGSTGIIGQSEEIMSFLKSQLALLEEQVKKIEKSGLVFSVSAPSANADKIKKQIAVLANSAASLSSGEAGITKEYLEERLNSINASLISQINNLSSQFSAQTSAVYRTISLTNKIDNLSGVSLSSITVSGVSGLTDADIPDTITASSYLPLVGGTLTGALTGTALSLSGQFTISGTGTSTLAGRLLATKAPTLAHTFSVWDTDTANSNVLDSSILINPSSAVADSNLFGIAVNNNVKFLVDAEGDVFVRNLTATGTVNQANTSISTLTVENTATFGDAVGDSVTFNAGTIASANPISWNLPASQTSALNFESGLFNLDTSNSRAGIGTTSPASKLDVWGGLRAGTSATPWFIVDSSTGFVGAGTSSPYSMLSVAGQIVGQNFVATSTTATSTFAGGMNVAGTAGLTVLQNGNVGMGTTPRTGYKLEVSGIISGTTLEFGGDNDVQITQTSEMMDLKGQAGFIFKTYPVSSWTEQMRIDSTGNIGIGTTSPYAKLSVVGQTVAEYFTATSTTATSTFAGGMNVAGTAGLTVLQNGNVGVGTMTPGAKLDVNGAILANSIAANAGGYNNPDFFQPVSGDSNWAYGISNIGSDYWMQVKYHDIGDLLRGFRVFDTNQNVVTFSNNRDKSLFPLGNVGIGTTSPYAKLSVVGQTVAEYFTATSTTATSTFAGGALFATGGGNVGLRCADPDHIFEIGGTGTGCNTGAGSYLNAVGDLAFTANSSREWKQNIATYGKADILSRIKNAPVRTFDWKPEYCPSGNCLDKLGFIAEEFYGVLERGDDKHVNGQDVTMALWLGMQNFINVFDIASAATGTPALVIDALGNWKIGNDGALTVKEVRTEKLCVGSVCVTEEQFRNVFGNSQSSAISSSSSSSSVESSVSSSSETVSSSSSSIEAGSFSSSSESSSSSEAGSSESSSPTSSSSDSSASSSSSVAESSSSSFEPTS